MIATPNNRIEPEAVHSHRWAQKTGDEMADVITTVTAAINLTKQLLGLAVVAKDANAKLVIADLQVQLAELKTRLAELIEENNQLKQEIRKVSATETDVVLKKGMYFTQDGDGPFCTACYDSKKQMIRVSEMGAAFHPIARWRCNVCNATYGGTL